MGCGALKQVGLSGTKKRAEKFALSVVKSYFEEDCEGFFAALSDSLIILDGDGVVAKVGRRERVCESMSRAVGDKDKSYQDYLDSYRVEMLSAKEVEERFGIKLPDYYQPQPGDWFFIGFEPMAEFAPFIWDDMFFFMVRKEQGRWKLKGVSG